MRCDICDTHWGGLDVPIYYLNMIDKHLCYHCIRDMLQRSGFLQDWYNRNYTDSVMGAC